MPKAKKTQEPVDVTASASKLRSIVERIERLTEEKKERQEDIKEVFVESKAFGFDNKIVRQLIKLRAADPSELAEAEALLDVYKDAMGMANQ